jgi:hypothetical protein
MMISASERSGAARAIRSKSIMQMKHVWARVLLVVAPLSAASVATADSVDVEIRSSDKVSGTIRPTYDVECFTCDLAKNTALTAVVKGRSKTGPAFKVAFRQNSADIAGPAFVPKAQGGTLKPDPVAASGQYQVCVFCDDGKDGDYDLVVTWKPQTTWTSTGGPLGGGGDDSFTFSAPAGSSATIDLAPGKGSAFKGDLLDVEGPGGFVLDLSDLPDKHAVVPFLPTTGEYTVNFTNAGGDGTWAGRVKLRVPKFKLRKFDLRDSKLGGAFAGDHTVVGREVDENGGTVLVQTGGASPLDGAGVSVPADSLSGPVVITVSAGTDLNTGDGSHTSGPAVEFGPTGTTFDPTKSAQITIPFDPSYFPGGDTTNLVVYVRAADGTITQVPPPYVINGNTVTFSTSHFSTYQAATTNPRPLEGAFLALEIKGDLNPNYEGQFGFGLHSAYVSGGSADVFNNQSKLVWSNFGGDGGSVTLSATGGEQTLAVSVKDDNTVQFIDPSQQVTTFARGISDDVLVGENQAIVLLRRPAGYATPALIAGAWHLFHLTFDGFNDQSTAPVSVQLKLRSETGTVTFTDGGSVLLSTTHQVESATQFPVGKWSTQVANKAGDTGITFFVDEGGGVEIQSPGGGPSFTLTPVLDGNMMVGLEYNESGSSPGVGLYMLVRNSTGVTTAKLAGAYQFGLKGAALLDFTAAEEPPAAQGFTFSVAQFASTVAPSGAYTIAGSVDVSSFDSAGNPSTSVGQPFGQPGKLFAKGDGSFTSTDPGTLGAISLGGGFALYLTSTSGEYDVAFGVRMPRD